MWDDEPDFEFSVSDERLNKCEFAGWEGSKDEREELPGSGKLLVDR
jgi:hypothetical protein